MEQKEIGTPMPRSEKKKRKGTMGWLAFTAMFLSVCVLLCIGVLSVKAYMERSIGEELFDMATLGTKVAVALAAVSVGLAIITFFLKNQKKGIAVFSLILALLIVLLSGAILYFYQYMFSAMEHDTEFEEIQEEELQIVQPDKEGMVDLQDTPQVEIKSEEEIIEQIQTKINLQELEWEYLLDTHVPKEGLDMMNSKTPIGKGYLYPNAEKIENYLLFGLDAAGASDAVLLLSFDRVHDKVKLISLARDSYVKIPEWGTYTKLAYAYAAGEEKTAVATVNYNYRLNVKDYITVRMDEIKQLVNLVGGVEVELDYDELNYMNRSGFYNLQYGRNLLKGSAAVVYSRMRRSSANDTEIKRTARQREVLMSMFQRAQEIPFSDYPEFVRSGMELCKTSLDSNKILAQLMEAMVQGYTMETYALVDKIDYWGGQFGVRNYYYLVYDLDGAADALYKIIYEDLYISGYKD